MPSLSPRRWNALAWLSILVAACGGSTSPTGIETSGEEEVVAMAGSGGATGNLTDTSCEAMAALPCPHDPQ